MRGGDGGTNKILATEFGNLKIVFLQKYVVVGKRRINLNASDIWSKLYLMHLEYQIYEGNQPLIHIELSEKTTFFNTKQMDINCR